MLLQSCATRAKALVKLNSDRTSATPSTQVAAPTVIISPTFYKFRFLPHISQPTVSISQRSLLIFFLLFLIELLTDLFLLFFMLCFLSLVPSSCISFFIYIYLRTFLYIRSYLSYPFDLSTYFLRTYFSTLPSSSFFLVLFPSFNFLSYYISLYYRIFLILIIINLFL